METDKILICRLCLEICKSGFELIEDSTKETLNFLLLNVDLEISNEPVVCPGCIDSLKECLNSKTDRLRKSGSVVVKHEDVDLNVPEIPLTERLVDPFHLECDSCINGFKNCLHSKTGCLGKSGFMIVKHEGVGLNVPEIHLTESEMDTPEINDSNKCCACKQLIDRESCVHWMNKEKTVPLMLEKYFPELILLDVLTQELPTLAYPLESPMEPTWRPAYVQNLNDPTDIMCVACYKSLQKQLAFISKCLAVEEEIKEYCKAEGTNSKGQVELGSVLHFVSKNQLQNNICSSINVFKMEKACEETEMDDNTKVENKNFVVLEEPGICSIEKEDIDIKTEQDNGDRFDVETAQETCMEQYSPSQNNMTEAAQFKCEVCAHLFKQKSSLLRHVKLHKHPSEVTMHKCKICTYQSRHRSKITEHMLVHKDPSEVTMHKCEVCSYQNKRKHKVSAHMLTHHKDPSELTMYKCELCAYQCRLKYRILEHMVTHKDSSEVVMHKCTMCSYQGKRMYNLRQHILRRHGPSDVTVYKCKICAYQCKLKHKLADHMLSHKDPSEVVMYMCDTCAYQSRKKNNLAKHIFNQHRPSEARMHKCKMCSFQCKHNYTFAEHMVTHQDPSEIITYKCKLCAYQSIHKHRLSKHMLIHRDPSEITMYKCEVCSYQNRRKDKLAKHMLTHKDPSEVIQYKCQKCTYQTIFEQRLSKHIQIHKDSSEVVMYKCELCTYQTRYKSNLSEHMVTHKDPSEVVMYKCEVCTYQGKRKRDISRHVLIHKTVS